MKSCNTTYMMEVEKAGTGLPLEFSQLFPMPKPTGDSPCPGLMDNQTNNVIHEKGTVMKKKHYERMSITPIELEASHPFLAGSNTLQNIEIQEVTVHDFEEDPSFPTDGFDVNFE